MQAEFKPRRAVLPSKGSHELPVPEHNINRVPTHPPLASPPYSNPYSETNPFLLSCPPLPGGAGLINKACEARAAHLA